MRIAEGVHAKEMAEMEAQIERLKTMSTVEMMGENPAVKYHIEAFETRCLQAEREIERLKVNQHHPACDSLDLRIKDKPCNCYLILLAKIKRLEELLTSSRTVAEQRRAEIDRLTKQLAATVRQNETLLRLNERMDGEAADMQAEIESVIQLGRDFGFTTEPFSVAQVITHAKYLQSERADLLFKNMEKDRDIARLKAEMVNLFPQY